MDVTDSNLCPVATRGAASCLLQAIFTAVKEYFQNVDWLEEARLWITATIIAIVIMPIFYSLSLEVFMHRWINRLAVALHLEGVDIWRPPSEFALRKTWRWLPQTVRGEFRWFKEPSPDDEESVRYGDHKNDEPRKRHVCDPSTCPYEAEKRAVITDEGVSIYAWASRGGMILLENVDGLDFRFLGLDLLDPPLKRDDDQVAEDTFCQQLLMLGAKWWDSECRYEFLQSIKDCEGRSREAYLDGEPDATMREKLVVKVAWPSTGGFWVSEFDKARAGTLNMRCSSQHTLSLGLIQMASTMDERCELLSQRYCGKFFERAEDYTGDAFIDSWRTKTTGEVGPLVQVHKAEGPQQ